MTYRAMLGGYGLYCGRVFFGGDQKGPALFQDECDHYPTISRARDDETIQTRLQTGTQYPLRSPGGCSWKMQEQRTIWAQLASNL